MMNEIEQGRTDRLTDMDVQQNSELSASTYRDQRATYRYWRSKLSKAWSQLKMRDKLKVWRENYKKLQMRPAFTLGNKTFYPPNIIKQATRELLGLCFPAVPMPEVAADNPIAEDQLTSYEWLSHNTLRKVENRKQLRKIIDDAVVCDFGLLKATYYFPEGTANDQEVEEPVLAQQMQQIQQEQALCLTGQVPPVQEADVDWLHIDRHRQQLTQLDIWQQAYWALSMHTQQHQMRQAPVKPGYVKLNRINREDFLYDPSAKDPEEWLWTAEASYEHIDDLRNDPLLLNQDGVVPENKRRSDVIRDSGELEDTQVSDLNDSDGDRDENPSYVKVWRIHDCRNNLLIVLAWNHRDQLPLYVGPWPYVNDQTGQPISIYFPLDLNPTNEASCKATIMEETWPLQDEYDANWAKMQVLIRAYMPKTGIEDGAMDPEDREEMEDDTSPYLHLLPGTMDKLREINLVPELKPIQDRLDELEIQIRKTLEVWEVTMGVAKADTATQSQILANKEDFKTQPKREIVNDWMSEICQTILALHKKFTSTAIMVKQIGGTEGLSWRLIHPEEIPDDLDCAIESWSWGESNPQLKRNQWVQLLPVVMASPEVNKHRLLVETFRRFDIRNPERFLNPPPVTPPALPQGQPISGVPGIASSESTGQMAGNAVGGQDRGQVSPPATAGVTMQNP